MDFLLKARGSFSAWRTLSGGRLAVQAMSFATAKAKPSKATAKQAARSATTKKKKEKVRKDPGKHEDEGPDNVDARLSRLMDSCLDVPPPVRHIKLKERLREKEMEELGLMTKARQQELEQEKAREKAKAQGASQNEDLKLTPEEGQRLAKEYSRFLMRDLRRRQAGESLRVRLKLAAIAALPPHLRKAAEVPDYSPFPPIHPATLSPPIPGYSHQYQSKRTEPTESS